MDTNTLNDLAGGGGSGTLFGISYATLFASLIWSSVGVGFFVYGKKQRSIAPWIGGVALMVISYFIPSPLWMSVAAVAIIAGVWYVSRY